MHSPSILLNAALEYARHGWRVIPLHTPTGDDEQPCSCLDRKCDTPGKHPRIREWQKQGTTDEAEIRRWWGMWPASNIGIVCGAGTGWFALDVDGEEGVESLRRLEAANSALPVGPAQLTGGQGRHYLFAYEPGMNNAVKFAPGLDLRTDGGMIVVEPSLHVSGREYLWYPNAHPFEEAVPKAPGWLLAAIRKASAKTGGAAAPIGDEIPQNQRNSTLASLAGTMRRRGMDPAAIEAALQVTNRDRCRPMLDESEVKQIAASIGRYAPAVPVNGCACVEDEPLNSLNSLSSFASANNSEPEWPAPLAPEAFYGRAGEIVKEIAPETEADEAALLVNLLVTFGNVVGRNPHSLVGRTRHGANLFAVLVGHTGGARKGTSWDPILDLFERALPGYPTDHIKGSVASGEGLISLVRDRSEKKLPAKKKKGKLFEEAETVIEDEGVSDKRLLIVSSEMSELLKVMARSGNILSEILRKAWESGNLDNLNKASPMKATGAHLSVIGHITPSGIAKHLNEGEAANGFANRFLWMASRRSKALPEGGDLPPLNSHVIALKELAEIASGKINIGREACARHVWRAVYNDLTAEGVGMFAELTARRAPIVLRLSLVYALFDGMGVVLAEHLLAALAVWERSEATVRFLFGDATGDPAADALYDAMVNRPEGATRTDLHHALGKNRPVTEIDRALTALQRSQKARMQRQKGEGGREVEAWHACPREQHQITGGYLAKARAAHAEYKNGL